MKLVKKLKTTNGIIFDRTFSWLLEPETFAQQFLYKLAAV